MDSRIASLWKNSHFREITGTVGVLAALVIFTEMSLRIAIPLFVIFGGMAGHDIADEMYDLPNGTNWLVYGTTVTIAGAYFAVIGGPLVGGILAFAGVWFVFDGVTTIRYEPSETEHEYISGLDGQVGETMLRMQTLNVVNQALKDAHEPQTPAELAVDLDLTESRTESALDFLESKNRVEQMGNRYRAKPPRWGRLTPVVQFITWIPRRIVRPFHRVVANT